MKGGCHCGRISFPDKIDVNVRCLEGVDIAALETEAFDGKNWEHAVERYNDSTKR